MSEDIKNLERLAEAVEMGTAKPEMIIYALDGAAAEIKRLREALDFFDAQMEQLDE